MNLPASPILKCALSSTLAVLVLSGCASGQWRLKYEQGTANLAAKPAQLKEAEASFRAAVADAEKHRVPEPEYAVAIAALGEVLQQQSKFVEAQDYLLRAVSLATATHMSTARNVHLLKLLESSYEASQNYESAMQTNKVLTDYVATELSPNSPEYAKAVKTAEKLKQRIAECQAADDDCCAPAHKVERKTALAVEGDPAQQLPGND